MTLSYRLSQLLSRRRPYTWKEVVEAVAEEVMSLWDTPEAVEATAHKGLSEADLAAVEDIIRRYGLAVGWYDPDPEEVVQEMVVDIEDYIVGYCQERLKER